MYNKLINKETKLSVIGLGYVGLPIALEFAKQISVVGFDIKPERVALMKKGIDPSNELTSEAFKNTDRDLPVPSQLRVRLRGRQQEGLCDQTGSVQQGDGGRRILVPTAGDQPHRDHTA